MSRRDTAGQERFDTITKQYYRRAQGVLLVYDISNATSFRHIDKWLGFLKSVDRRVIAADASLRALCRQHGSAKCEVMLVGNKTDLDEWRQVPRADGESIAEKHGFGFGETSALAVAGDLDSVSESLHAQTIASIALA